MFRYGGNVKAQGVMHGMKNMQDGGPATMADATGYANGGMSNNQGPRRAALVGNPAYSVGPDGRTNRGNQVSFKGDKTKPFELGLKENDEAIFYYLENVIKPSVIQNGVKTKVPVYYGSPERWAQVK